ncbi:MAG TPA: AbrB/MazE/SpoVT family DNA-binding domain-containing protein [Steroidobacteraceae bacterium]|nr:AbrB/MazE/SpoVT family DNA-binding domain-containing protein [Steroidobacteraceae bacterium]
MALAESKITAQGQVSIPAEIRKRLGVGPGSTLVWDVDGDHIIVRRAARYSSLDIHRGLFPNGALEGRKAVGVKEGIRRYTRSRHARD